MIFNLFATLAWAADAGGPTGIQRWGGFITLILIFVIFYVLLIWPQQKRQKQHRKMVEALKKGDKVITMGGIHGVIIKVDEDTVTLKVDEDVKLVVSKHAISAVKKR